MARQTFWWFQPQQKSLITSQGEKDGFYPQTVSFLPPPQDCEQMAHDELEANCSLFVAAFTDDTLLHLVPHITFLSSSHCDANTLSVLPNEKFEGLNIKGNCLFFKSLILVFGSFALNNWRFLTYSNTDIVQMLMLKSDNLITSTSYWNHGIFKKSKFWREPVFIHVNKE